VTFSYTPQEKELQRRLDWATKQLDEAGANYVRLEGVIIAADRWRATLDLDQTSFSGLDFCCEFADYDKARDEVRDLLPIEGDEPGAITVEFIPDVDLNVAVQAADRVFAKEPT
jgi:hypothetical protein